MIFAEVAKSIADKPQLAAGINAVVAWHVQRGGRTQMWIVDLRTGKQPSVSAAAEVPAGVDPAVSITVADEDLVRMALGELGAPQAFMSGRLKVKGNIMLAQKIDALFRKEAKNNPTLRALRTGGDALQSAAVFEQLAKRVAANPDLVGKVKAVFEYHITRDGKEAAVWTVDLKNGPGSVRSGAVDGKADASITISDEDFVALATGKAKAQKLFMSGRLKVKGNIMLAQKLEALFRASDAGAPRAKL